MIIMKKILLRKKHALCFAVLVLLLASGCALPVFREEPVPEITENKGQEEPQPSLSVDITPVSLPDSTETPVLEPTVILTPTVSPTPTVTPTPTISPTPTVTPTPTISPTPTPSPTPTEVPIYDQIVQVEQMAAKDSDISAKAALLVNLTKNQVVYSENAMTVIYPASLTKLMTALLAFQQEIPPTQFVTINKSATVTDVPSAKMCGFQEGDRILFKDLLSSMLIYSGNDTSIAIAEHISGTEAEFVALMNQKAKEIGLTSTVFRNSHGLPDDNHVTSAYDIYLIMQKLFNFDEFLGIIDTGSIKVNVLQSNSSVKTYTFTSTNQFLSGNYALPEALIMLGGKTGTTNKAGCCLALYVIDKDGDCYIAEIFGAGSYDALYKSMIQLLSHISE